MAELDLPAGPAQLLEAVRKPLADHLGGERHIRLGGGTALAARWAHRDSADVDLFVGDDAYAKLYRNSYQFTADIEGYCDTVGQLGVGPGHTIIALPDGEITVLATRSLTDQPVSRDTVRGTRIGIESTTEILAKKLTHRVATYHIFVPRDLYDIAVARRLDPEALNTALATIPPPSLDDVRHALALLPSDWAVRHRKPLLQPAHARDATDSVAIVQRVIERYLADGNPPTPHRGIRPSQGR